MSFKIIVKCICLSLFFNNCALKAAETTTKNQTDRLRLRQDIVLSLATTTTYYLLRYYYRMFEGKKKVTIREAADKKTTEETIPTEGFFVNSMLIVASLGISVAISPSDGYSAIPETASRLIGYFAAVLNSANDVRKWFQGK